MTFESPHVRPLAFSDTRLKLYAVNTEQGTLEVFDASSGALVHSDVIPVGVEPVTVRLRRSAAGKDIQAWVINHISDSVSIIDLDLGTVIETLAVGDAPTDVAIDNFDVGNGRACVVVSREHSLQCFLLSDLTLPPVEVPLNVIEPF